jgi:hypothetical protein
VVFRIGVATLTKVDVFQWMIFSIGVAIATDATPTSRHWMNYIYLISLILKAV